MNPSDPNGPVVPTGTGPSNDPMDMIRRSAQMRGNQVRPEDVTYWMGKWDEAKHDPGYFWSLLMRPEGGGASGGTGMTDPLVYKTLPQVTQGLTPELPTYGVQSMMPGLDTPPPESRIFGTAGGTGTLDPREAKRAAIVRMLGRG